MKIIADENIIFVEEAFSSLGDVFLYNGREITNAILKDADVLLVRSITNVNADLLDNTNVKFVGTATIGTDHIDKDYLEEKGIYFTDAKGCNSDAVSEYVFNVLLNIADERGFELKDKTIGVVGVGNIGSRIVRMANALRMKVLQNDPPLQRLTGNAQYRELNELMDADVITFHVPLNLDGVDRTYHLFDSEKLKALKNGAIIVNASRGPVIVNDSLNELIKEKNFTVVLDVWENEPDIKLDLLEKVRFGTPHIAGYSIEGKINGTVILYNALCGFLNIVTAWAPTIPPAVNPDISINGNSSIEKELYKAADHAYKIKKDDMNIRGMLTSKDPGKYFDELRKKYDLRREFPDYTADIDPYCKDMAEIFKSFRFNIKNNK
jgi:erythronate-4-phosphate dehydrogenase